ncbi:MAG: tripartite tricarboxylate transporter substrate binding protein [Hyphomicrobiales bacterium]|nr:tripartite tricarboxylate transporter substrate binding protein [Hyphomicrobiales bacterium]
MFRQPGWLRWAGRLALMAALAAPVAAAAEKYPDRPIRLIVPFPPGGGNDIMARFVAAQVEAQVAQPVVIDNRGGANGIIGTQAVANAPPDGYTLLHVSSSFTINPAVYKKLPFDIFRDFVPVANAGIGAGYVVVVNPQLPIHNPADLIAYAKKNRIFYGSSGTGNPIQLAAESFKVHAGIEMDGVPFRGTAPGLTAVIQGSVQVMFVPPGSALAFIEGGQLRAIGFTGERPSSDLPGVPLVRDTVPTYSFTGAWHGWFAPAKTPDAIVRRLNAEVRAAVKVRKVIDGLRQTGYEPSDQSPEEFAVFVRKDAESIAEAVRAAKIEPQ